MKTKRNIVITLILATLILGCYKEPDFTNFDYKTYNRVIGPNGGTIDFYANYADDNENTLSVSLNFPQGALDSMMVFNMYQFEDYELVLQMEDGYAEIGSKFLYFVPFFESDGYHERGKLDISYHLSVDFNSPVEVTYNYLTGADGTSAETWQESQLYYDYYKKTNRSYQLYRIKIPKLDEWGESDNIYVNWNNQGYPDGYDRTDLYYLISGIWSPLSNWGEGYFSLENWEPVPDFVLNNDNNSVSFQISNTDYMYVLCRIIYIKAEDVPIKIVNEIEDRFPSVEIERASFSNDEFVVFLSDNTYATFSKGGDFQYLTDANLSKSELPIEAQNYINTNYVDDALKKVTRIQWEDWNPHEYEVLLSSGIKLYFDFDGNFTGSFQYGVDHEMLPDAAMSYLNQTHYGELITNVTFDNENTLDPTYIVYLSSDAKVYFNAVGDWLETLYYRTQEEDLPQAITDYFEEEYPDVEFSAIHYTETPSDGNYYDIYTIDSKWFTFNEEGEPTELEFENLEEEDLPAAILEFINEHFQNREITEIYYYWYAPGVDWYDPDGGESYDIYFDDRLNIEMDPDGTVTAIYGNSLQHLPIFVRNRITTNYPDENVQYCQYNIDNIEFPVGQGDIVSVKWDIFFEGNFWLGLDEDLDFAYFQKFEALIDEMPEPIMNYLNTNYPAYTTASEFSNYYSSTYAQYIYYVGLDYDNNLIFDQDGNLIDQYKSTGAKKSLRHAQEKPVNKKRIEKAEALKLIEELKKN